MCPSASVCKRGRGGPRRSHVTEWPPVDAPTISCPQPVTRYALQTASPICSLPTNPTLLTYELMAISRYVALAGSCAHLLGFGSRLKSICHLMRFQAVSMASRKTFALVVGERRTCRPLDFFETSPASCRRLICSTAVDCSMPHSAATSLTQREGFPMRSLTISIRRWFANPATILARPLSFTDMTANISTYCHKSISNLGKDANEPILISVLPLRIFIFQA